MISKFIRLTGKAVGFVINSSAVGQFVEADVEILHEPVGTNSGDNFSAIRMCSRGLQQRLRDGVLVAAPGVDAGASNVGVVHLFDGATGIAVRSTSWQERTT